MAKFVAEKKYERNGKKVEIGKLGGQPAVKVGKKVVAVDVHVETRQFVNPMRSYETHGTLEEVANSIADEMA